jgi:AsmA protein
MKIIKLTAFALGGVAALLSAVVLYVAITFDANRVKDELRRVVLEQKQRTLDIEGDVDLSFYPNLGLKLGRASLSEHNSTDPFAAIGGARVSVALLPLLSGTLVVDEIRVEGGSVSIVRFKDGSLNIDDLMSAEKDESSPVRFDIAGMRLSGSRLAFRDEASGAVHTLDSIELATGKLSNAAQGRLDLAAHWTSAKPAADSRIVIGAAYDYDLAARRYALDTLNASLDGTLQDLTDVRLVLTSGRLEATAEGRIDLQKLAFDLKAKRAGGESLAVKLAAPALLVAEGGLRSDEISIATNVDSQSRAIAIKLLLTGVESNVELLKVTRLALEADGRQDTVTVKGSVSTPMTILLGNPSVELPSLDGSFDIAHPALPMKTVKLPIKGAARADLKAQTAAFDLDTRLDESHIVLKLSATRLDPLALTFDLDIDRLNVDRYLPPAAADAKADTKTPARPDDTPVDLSALRGIDASGTVKIGDLQVSGVKMTNMSLKVKSAKGRVDVAPYSASLYEGAASGALSLNADGNRITLKQTLSDVDVYPLIRDVAGKDILEGRGTVSLDVATSGATVGALRKALDGTASLKLRDGAIRGINLAKSLREAKAKLGVGGGASVQQANTTEKTDFSALSASFRIDDGVARNTDLIASSPFLRLAGSGRIDLGESTMDYVARVTLAATSKGQDGKSAAELKGLTVPVRLHGPFASLDYKIEFGDLVKDAARAKVQQQTQRLQDKAQEKVGEKLKGLFGQ